MKKLTFLFSLLLLTAIYSFAQIPTASKAKEYLINRNFQAALPLYKNLAAKHPDNVRYNYNVAVCYLNTDSDKPKAIPYLKKILKYPIHNQNALFLLGRAYQFAYQFDSAKAAFIKFKTIGKGNKYNLDNVEQQIKYCDNAKELIKYPVKVKFQDLSSQINSPYPDFYPFVPKNESFMLFNSRRDDGSTKRYDGKYHSEIYLSHERDGKWVTARLLSKINTPDGDEEVVGMSPNGKKVLFLLNNKIDQGNLYIADFDASGVSNLQKLPDAINSKHDEIAATITDKGDKIYFASDRPGGYGGVDLYVVKKLPNGKWSLPQNLGPTINTKQDEDFPSIAKGGKVLYFSSKGHLSMGGYDIFRAEWDAKKQVFDKVENLGYPINTVEDNTNIRVNESGRYGYMSAIRKNTKGSLDVYKLTFTDISPRYTVMKGIISAPDSTFDISSVSITVNDNKTGNLFGTYAPNPRTGRYIMILPPGRYTMMIDAPGYKSITKVIGVMDKSSFQPIVNQNIKLTKAKK